MNKVGTAIADPSAEVIMAFPRTLLLLLFVFQAPSILEASVIPGRWEKLESQPVGTGVEVTLKSGLRYRAFLKSVGGSSLTITDPATGELTLPKSEIERVSTIASVNDPMVDGTIIGAAVVGGLAALGASQADGSAGSKAGGVAFYGGIGALVGYFIDRSATRPKVLYKAR